MGVHPMPHQSTADHITDLLEQMCAVAKNREVERISDQISTICMAYFEPDPFGPIPPKLDSKLFTPGERAALSLLYQKRGKVVSKQAITDVMPRDTAEQRLSKLADVRICHIRRKLRGTPWQNAIETVRGIGYRLETQCQA